MDIKEYFVPFEVAKILRDKEFREECLALYYDDSDFSLIGYNNISSTIGKTAAPMYDQVIDWLENKHGILIEIKMDITMCWWYGIGPAHPDSTYKGQWIYSPLLL